jgi:RNA polymerase sigma-70 factor (ECF subfamily)
MQPRSAERTARANDRDLAERLQKGDEAAFAELDRLYRRRVYAFALKRLRDATEAEDVTQDVFLQIFRCIDKFEGRSSLAGWILGIAHHEVCNRFRRRVPTSLPVEQAEAVESHEPAPDRKADAARTLGRCEAALERHVSAPQRRIFRMRFSEGRSVNTIAERLGKSPHAVKIGLFRTRRALAQHTPGLKNVLSA